MDDCSVRGEAIQRIVDELLVRTRALRVTVRLKQPHEVFPVVAQARRDGARSLEGELSAAAQSAPTFSYLSEQKRVLVQDDVLAAEVAPPAELIDVYGTRAQVLAPVVIRGAVVAIVAVHDGPAVRRWTESDIGAIKEAAKEVRDALGGYCPDMEEYQ
ncbi:MAG: GAF domain-containing protein [Vicinamibacterales bacterium]